MAPDPAGNLLGAADHQPLVLVTAGHDDPEDLQHGVRIVRVPAAGAESDLAEDLAVVKRPRGERLGARHEVVERAVVPAGHQIVPQRLQRPDVARPDRVLDGGVAHLFQGLRPCVRDLGKHRGKVVQRARIVRDALKIDDRAPGRLGQRVGERPGLQAQHVDVAVERRRRRREPHPAQFRDHAVGSLEGLRTQPPAHPRGLVDHWLEAEPHQLVRSDQSGDASADDSNLFAMTFGRNRAQASRVRNPAVEREREVRAEHRDRALLAMRPIAATFVHHQKRLTLAAGACYARGYAGPRHTFNAGPGRVAVLPPARRSRRARIAVQFAEWQVIRLGGWTAGSGRCG